MDKQIIYDKIRDDEDFVDALWNKYDVSEKLEALRLSGWTNDMMIEDYMKTMGENNEQLDV